jgi:hypothetical protein
MTQKFSTAECERLLFSLFSKFAIDNFLKMIHFFLIEGGWTNDTSYGLE